MVSNHTKKENSTNGNKQIYGPERQLRPLCQGHSKELSELAGVASVEGDPGMKVIKVEWEAPATEDNLRATLKEINYPAAD